MYQIKQIPDDFVVKELSELKFKEKGSYSYYLLKKIEYTTVAACNLVAEKLRIKPKYINFAGTKDKKAVTEQFISIQNGPKKDLKLKDIELKFLGKGDERLNLGKLQGNAFEITVRNLDKVNVSRIEKIPNYFDEQRFGKNKNNHIIGKHIIKKQFKEACEQIPELGDYLEEKPNDYVGALRSLDKQVLRMYVHAYQSWLWNKTAEQLIKEEKKNNIKLPILGFETELEGNLLKIIKPILEAEKLSLRDFIIRQIPELSNGGTERDLFAEVKNLKINKPEADELNNGKKKVKISFELQKGSYATIVIKELFS